MSERVARLREQREDLQAQELAILETVGGNVLALSPELRGDLVSIRARIDAVVAATLEAEEFSLTGDGEARP